MIFQTYFCFENLHAVFVFEGEEENVAALRIHITTDNLTVSWKPFSKMPANLKEYVVQYKQYGSGSGQSFDWVRLIRSQTTAFFRGLLLMFLEKYSIQCGFWPEEAQCWVAGQAVDQSLVLNSGDCMEEGEDITKWRFQLSFLSEFSV